MTERGAHQPSKLPWLVTLVTLASLYDRDAQVPALEWLICSRKNQSCRKDNMSPQRAQQRKWEAGAKGKKHFLLKKNHPSLR